MATRFECIRSAADTWVALANIQQKGPASCVVHREENTVGCIRCINAKSAARYESGRLCDLMRQGIWKTPRNGRR